MIGGRLSETIKLLRAPMALLIICVHADFTREFSYRGKEVLCIQDFGYHIVNYISHSLTDFAVPLFFIISGLLYSGGAARRGYKILILNKFRTLVLPYVLWNIIFFVAFFASKGYSVVEFLEGLWCIPGRSESLFGVLTQPWDGPLWFLRDLIVVFLLVPLIDFFIRNMGLLYIGLLFLLYATKIIPWYIIPGISITSLLMFSIGVYLERSNCDWLSSITPYRFLILFIFLFLSIYTYYLGSVQKDIGLFFNILHALTILFGISAAFSMANSYTTKTSLLYDVGKSSFIIFASHTLFLTYLIKLVMVPFGYQIANIQTLFIYFTSIFSTYFITYMLGVLISKNSLLNSLLAGGR